MFRLSDLIPFTPRSWQQWKPSRSLWLLVAMATNCKQIMSMCCNSINHPNAWIFVKECCGGEQCTHEDLLQYYHLINTIWLRCTRLLYISFPQPYVLTYVRVIWREIIKLNYIVWHHPWHRSSMSMVTPQELSGRALTYLHTYTPVVAQPINHESPSLLNISLYFFSRQVPLSYLNFYHIP